MDRFFQTLQHIVFVNYDTVSLKYKPKRGCESFNLFRRFPDVHSSKLLSINSFNKFSDANLETTMQVTSKTMNLSGLEDLDTFKIKEFEFYES